MHAGWHLPFHFYHFNPGTLREYARAWNYEVVRLCTVTPEFLVRYSLNAQIGNKGGKLMRYLNSAGLFNTIAFRLCAASFFRICDFLKPGKGECLQAELMKPQTKG